MALFRAVREERAQRATSARANPSAASARGATRATSVALFRAVREERAQRATSARANPSAASARGATRATSVALSVTTRAQEAAKVVQELFHFVTRCLQKQAETRDAYRSRQREPPHQGVLVQDVCRSRQESRSLEAGRQTRLLRITWGWRSAKRTLPCPRGSGISKEQEGTSTTGRATQQGATRPSRTQRRKGRRETRDSLFGLNPSDSPLTPPKEGVPGTCFALHSRVPGGVAKHRGIVKNAYATCCTG